ncbi:CvpA family protein [Erythrobacter sp. LQ02-29]|uniref:CvpA family protein n=1 Tax=unclassified Erythrobacter TaxID=2633097 RepID=UPI001BFCBBFF|nr:MULTISPECIES: CvpA family protein [unclassified Erythrobacter]MCP9223231.1 CvpA family protein [Erythrobacter sp. LQ02-29]QWC58158.1 CvpA family protein [Erythrobacter sp. 3-20A1M]
MTAFDIIVLVIVGFGAVGGFARGFVQEVLSLLAWVAAIVAIRYFHEPLLAWLAPKFDSETTAAVVAFLLLLGVSYGLMRLIATRAGKTSRNSMLGPVDRALGFGFGALKGAVIVMIAFSIVVLGYDTIWGEEGRPDWITQARTYPVVNAATDATVTYIQERRTAQSGTTDEDEEPAAE